MKLKPATLVLNRSTDKPGTEAVLVPVQYDHDSICKMLRQVRIYFSNGAETWARFDNLASTETKLSELLKARGLKRPVTMLRGGRELSATKEELV